MEQTTALSVTTKFHEVGDVTSLIYNSHDDCFYACETTSNSIIRIKGEESTQFYKFEGNLVPKAIDFYESDKTFFIVLDGPNPAIYKKPMDGQARKVAEHVVGRDCLEYATGITINQNTGDAYISSRNDSVHKLTPAGELKIIKPKSWRGALMSGPVKGLQGILYDSEASHLLICDAASGRIIKLNATTGKYTPFCDVPSPWQIAKPAHGEYLVTSIDSFKVYLIVKEGEKYQAKPFAGFGLSGTKDGKPAQARFASPKGIAVYSDLCLVSDTNCIRAIKIESLPIKPSTIFRRSPSAPVTFTPAQFQKQPSHHHSPAAFFRSLASARSRNVAGSLSTHLLSSSVNTVFTYVHPSPEPLLPLRASLSAKSDPIHSPPSKLIIKMQDLSNLELIGEDAHSVVYKAEWMGQEVIYKRIKLLAKTQAEDKQNFVREFSIWQSATHPSCVGLHGLINEDNDFGFVAEHFPNGNLRRESKFTEKMVLSAIQSIRYAVDLANAINFLHGKNIAHRDIKCGNILLDQNMQPKLGHFGTAKSIHIVLTFSSLVGSLFYTAPEIIDGEQEDPLASDVYSFGILLHELATSSVIRTSNMPVAHDKPEGFPKEERDLWWDLVRECTQKKPSDRPVMTNVVIRLNAIHKRIQEVKCKKHGKLNHDIFISYCATDKDIHNHSQYHFILTEETCSQTINESNR